LKIETEHLEDHQVKLTVELETAPLEKAKHQAARQIAKKVKIPGFRPGKAPYGVIVRTVGESAVVEDAIELLVNDIYPKVLEEAEIEAYGPGSLENVGSLEPPTLIFTVPLEPEVELGDYKALDISYEPPAVGDEQIDAKLKELQEQHVIRETVERPAEVGDMVFMQLSAHKTRAEEDEDATIYDGRFSSSVIHDPDHQPEQEWPYPGFSQELIGITAKAEKNITYTYPEDHGDENLQGVEVEFHVVVTNIQSRSYPELDDEFAKTASDFDTLEELKEDIRKDFEAEASQNYVDEYDTLVLDKLIEDSTIKYPPQMVEREKSELINNIDYQLSRQGISKELYLQIRRQSEEEFNAELSPVAEDRVKRGLVLMQVAKMEEIKVDPEILTAQAERTFNAVTRGMTPKDVQDLQKRGYTSALVYNINADLLTQKTMEYLRAIAKGEPLPEENNEPEEGAGEEIPGAEAAPEEAAPTGTPEAVTVPEGPTQAEATPSEQPEAEDSPAEEAEQSPRNPETSNENIPESEEASESKED
jgi:trigger factor